MHARILNALSLCVLLALTACQNRQAEKSGQGAFAIPVDLKVEEAKLTPINPDQVDAAFAVLKALSKAETLGTQVLAGADDFRESEDLQARFERLPESLRKAISFSRGRCKTVPYYDEGRLPEDAVPGTSQRVASSNATGGRRCTIRSKRTNRLDYEVKQNDGKTRELGISGQVTNELNIDDRSIQQLTGVGALELTYAVAGRSMADERGETQYLRMVGEGKAYLPELQTPHIEFELSAETLGDKESAKLVYTLKLMNKGKTVMLTAEIQNLAGEKSYSYYLGNHRLSEEKISELGEGLTFGLDNL